MRTVDNRGNMLGQVSSTLALIIAIVALVVAIWAWTRADPDLAAEIDNRAAEVRQEMTQQAAAFQAELEELRQQLFEEADDEEEDDEEED